MAGKFRELMALLKSDDLDVSLGTAARVHRVCRPEVMRMIAAELTADLRSRNTAVREKAHQLFLVLMDRMPGGVNENEYEEPPVGFRVAALVKDLTSRDRFVQLRAIEQLGELKEPARITLPVLERLLLHPDGEVQLAAAMTIGSITGEMPVDKSRGSRRSCKRAAVDILGTFQKSFDGGKAVGSNSRRSRTEFVASRFFLASSCSKVGNPTLKSEPFTSANSNFAVRADNPSGCWFLCRAHGLTAIWPTGRQGPFCRASQPALPYATIKHPALPPDCESPGGGTPLPAILPCTFADDGLVRVDHE